MADPLHPIRWPDQDLLLTRAGTVVARLTFDDQRPGANTVMIDSGPATCTVHLGRDTGRPVPPDDSPWWHRQALCRGIDTDVFFPSDEAYLPERVRHERVAKAICAACPVRRPCAVHALVHREPHGVWGGLSAADRRDRLAQP